VKPIRSLLLAFAGLCLPLALALAVYLTSARSLAAPPPIGAVPTQIAKASPKTPTTTSKANKKREDRSGNCDEAEHANDPKCRGGTTTSQSGSSGSGSGSSGSGSSGSGSSGSGSSGSDDDSSGSGPSGSGSDNDSSGKGSGDDSSGEGSGDD
jgi:hypothetical protein